MRLRRDGYRYAQPILRNAKLPEPSGGVGEQGVHEAGL